MPTNLYFPGGQFATTDTADVSEVQILRGVVGTMKTTAIAAISAASRVRTLSLTPAHSTSVIRSKGVKVRVKLAGGKLATTSRAEVKYLINAAPISPPAGFLFLGSLATLSGQSAPSFSQTRAIKGDLTPIFFRIEGERLQSLHAKFIAKQKNVAGGVVPLRIEKTHPDAIEQTDPALDSATGIEVMTGNFSINAADTASFPETGEVEMGYAFQLTDGMGRTYTIEQGSFTVYSL